MKTILMVVEDAVGAGIIIGVGVGVGIGIEGQNMGLDTRNRI
jgi:hypothetical protein